MCVCACVCERVPYLFECVKRRREVFELQRGAKERERERKREGKEEIDREKER